jgi:hypothetical protein
MKFTKLNRGWNADVGAPEENVVVAGDTVVVEFYLSYSSYKRFPENDKGKLTFTKCHKYSIKGTNDEGYYMGQHRYKDEELPWGEFYKLETNWRLDFAEEPIFLLEPANRAQLNHYIFFFRDNSFECVAADYKIEFLLHH